MATIPANNNTGLYNTSGVPATTGNDLTVTGNVNANNVNAVNTINAGTNITAGGNVTADYFIGDGSLLTNINAGNIVGSYGNANVAAYLASGSNSSNVVTTGNVSGTYILGDGSQLTGLPATYGNANVNAHMAAFGSNTIVTTGNITGGYLFGNGSQLTGIAGSYGNANVAAFLPTYTGNLAGGNGSITNDLTVGGTIYGTFSGNISGNLVVPGSNTQVLFNNNGNAGASADFTFNDATKVLDVNGNIDATTFIGSGAGLTSIPGANVTGTVANATYATSAGTATSATTAGTVTTAAQPNITSVGTLTSLTTSGNVDVGGSLNTDDVTSTGNVTIYGNQIITGNLTVQGTTTTINSNTITTNDKTITVANNQSTGANVNGAGLEAGNPAVATFLYEDATTTWKSSIGLAAVGNITGSYILGNGSQLTGLPATYTDANVNTHLAAFGSNTIVTTGNITGGNIIGNGQSLTNLPGANVVGAVANATYATSAGTASTATDAAHATVADSANSVTGGNVTGQVANALVAGTVYTAAQPAITSVGTLTSLGVTGNITTGGILTNGYYYANGTPLSFGGSYGDSNVTTLLGSLGANAINSTANITTTANISGAYILGNGSQLTGLPATYSNADVNAHLAAFGSNVLTTTGNITGGNIIGTNLLLTGNISNPTPGVGGLYVNVADGLTVNASAGSWAGNITQADTGGSGLTVRSNNEVLAIRNNSDTTILSVVQTGANVTGYLGVSGNVTGGNLVTAGQVVAGGNISGNYILGNGSLLTGIASSYGDSNVNTHLAAFGSNTITTTGNITGGNLISTNGVVAGYINTTGATGNITGANYVTANYFVGNGSLLTGVTATANLAGPMSGDITGGNVYSINFIKDLAITGNISNPAGSTVVIEGITTAGLINSTGNITTTANISGSYILGNGSQLTGITPSLSGSLTGNITTGSYYITNPGAEVLMGNVWVTGTLAANTISSPAGDYVNIEGVASTNGLNSSGNINALNRTSVNFYETGSTNYLGFRAPTSVAADVVWELPGADGTSGQALSTYGNGVMYWATAGGGGSPGGSNTQIQFNDGGSFAGNAAITFNKTSGNIGLGNLIVNTQQIQTTQAANVALSSDLTPNPGRVYLGTGYNGNTSTAYDINNGVKGARFAITDSYGITAGNSVVRGLAVQNYYTLNGNVTSTNTRLAGQSTTIIVGGGSSANTISGAISAVIATGSTVQVGGGTSGNLTGLGNTTVQYASGVFSGPTVNAGSTGGNLYGYLSFATNNGTANTIIGSAYNFQGTGTFSNVYGVYMAGATNNHGYAQSNTARNAANYFFLKNEDDHAYSDVGQLTQYQESQYALTSSGGAVAVSKTNGQVQLFTVSEDATMSFSNFVVSSTVSATTRYMTDTVTVIVKQDGTGRTITMPSGAAYKYAAGGNVVPSTADSVSMISITAYYDSGTAATAYLVSISPEFS